MANELFRDNVGLSFLDIPKLIEGAMEAHKDDHKTKDVTLEDILSCDAWARQHVIEKSCETKKTRFFGDIGFNPNIEPITLNDLIET